MADQVSLHEFAQKIRERRPDLSSVPDVTLVAKTLAAAPELKQYVDIGNLPGMDAVAKVVPDARTPGMVASDQAANVLRGIPQVVTGIPAAISALGGLAKDIGTGHAGAAVDKVKTMLAGMAQPVTTPIKGALSGQRVSLPGLPGSVQFPEFPEGNPANPAWGQAAQGAGAMLGAAELPNVVSGINQYVVQPLANRVASAVDTTKAFNRAAKVPAGRRGVEVNMNTGEVKTNPGNAPVRALEGSTPVEKVKAAVSARPNEDLRTLVRGEYEAAGKALDAHLGKSTAAIDLSQDLPVELPKVKSALESAGVPPDQLTVSASKAHQIRSELGGRINWNPDVLNDANEAMKEAWSKIGDKIDSASPGISPFNKRWQEAYLYNKSLKAQLEKIAAGGKIPLSAAQDALMKVIRATGYGAGGIGLGKILLDLKNKE